MPTTPVTGTIVINNNSSATNNPNVTLALTWSDGTGSGVTQMRFSNDNKTWGGWVSVAATAAWTLSTGNGTRTVCAQFKNAAGNVSVGTIADSITLDTTSPTGTIVINNDSSVTNGRHVTLTLAWSDGTGSGVSRMRFSNDGQNWTAWQLPAATVTYTLPAGPDGHRTVRVQYLDKANNYSAVYSRYILLDTIPPTGTIVINNGAQTTSSQYVTLGLTWSDGSGGGVTRMRFSDDGTHWTIWEPPTATRMHQFPTGDGYKTVRVQYCDKAGNYSVSYRAYILLDTTSPTGGIVIDGGAATTTRPFVTLTLNWADAGVGVSQMHFSDDGITWTGWKPLAAIRAHRLPAGLGYHTVHVQYIDKLNNHSPVYKALIKSISTAPPVQISIDPAAVRTGSTAVIRISWRPAMPPGALLEWSASAGQVSSTGTGQYVYTAPSEPGRAFIYLAVTTAQGAWSQCAVPVEVYRQFIILKADDFNDGDPANYVNFTDYLETLKARGVKSSIGMIAAGCALPSIGQRTSVSAWRASGLFEFWNHGYDHAEYPPGASKSLVHVLSLGDDLMEKSYLPGTTFEFMGRPYAEQLDHLTRAQQTIQDAYGFRMRTFGAPFNKIDANTTLALEALGQIDVSFFGPSTSSIYLLPRNAGEIESSPGVPSLITYTQTHDLSKPVAVLQHHPSIQTFHDNWGEFIAILDQIHSDGGTFILAGEYADLIRHGTLPVDPTSAFADPALECALRFALKQWAGPIDPAVLV